MSTNKVLVLKAVAGYLRGHPEEIVRAVKNALALRVGVPLQALRWWAAQGKGRKAPRDLEIEARPPGLYVAASFELMNTPLRASAVVYIEDVSIRRGSFRLELRLDRVELSVLDDKADTPIAALLRSGALDLSRPGNLAAYMPRRPAVLVEAKDDRIVLDLLRHPKFQAGRAKKIFDLVTPLLGVRAVAAEDEHVDVDLEPFPEGLSEALQAVQSAL